MSKTIDVSSANARAADVNPDEEMTIPREAPTTPIKHNPIEPTETSVPAHAKLLTAVSGAIRVVVPSSIFGYS